MNGDPHAGRAASYKVSWELHRAAEMVHQVAEMRRPGARGRGDHRLRRRATTRRSPRHRAAPGSRVVAVTGWQDGRLHSAVLVSPGRERRRDRKLRKAAARALMAEDREARRTEAKREGRRAHRREARDRHPPPGRRARTCRAAHARPVPAPPPPGHLRHARRRLPVPRRRRPRQRRRLRRPGPLLRQLVRLRPLDPLRPRPDHRTRTSSSPASSAPASPASPRASTPARSRSAAASTSPATPRASTPPSPKPSAAGPSRSGHGMPNRLNPLDEGHRPSGLDDAQWASQIASRRRDLVGALAETVLDRRLTPLEHTAVDIAIDRTVRACRRTRPPDGRRPTPRPRPGRRSRRAAHRGRPPRRPRPAPPRRRRPRRAVRRPVHGARSTRRCR